MDPMLLISLLIAIILTALVTYLITIKIRDYQWKGKIKEHRQEAISQSRAVLSGQFSEQLAPFLPDFPYSPTECRFIGKPIDFLVFEGMDDKAINEVVFVEVKTNKSKLSQQEKNLKEAIKNKRVRWEEYRPYSTSHSSEDLKEF